MAAGDQKYSNDESDLVNTRPRNPNVNSLKYHMAGHFKGSKPSKNKFNIFIIDIKKPRHAGLSFIHIIN